MAQTDETTVHGLMATNDCMAERHIHGSKEHNDYAKASYDYT